MNMFDFAAQRIEEFGSEPDQLERSPITGEECPLLYIVINLFVKWGIARTQTWLMSVYLTYLDDYAYETEHDMYMSLIPPQDNGWLL